MTDHPSNAFEVLLRACGHHGVTRIEEPPRDVQRLNRINRAWLADDELEQRLPAVMRPECWRGCWG